MEPNNEGLEDDFPFQTGDFFTFQLFIFRGVINHLVWSWNYHHLNTLGTNTSPQSKRYSLNVSDDAKNHSTDDTCKEMARNAMKSWSNTTLYKRYEVPSHLGAGFRGGILEELRNPKWTGVVFFETILIFRLITWTYILWDVVFFFFCAFCWLWFLFESLGIQNRVATWKTVRQTYKRSYEQGVNGLLMMPFGMMLVSDGVKPNNKKSLQ